MRYILTLEPFMCRQNYVAWCCHPERILFIRLVTSNADKEIGKEIRLLETVAAAEDNRDNLRLGS